MFILEKPEILYWLLLIPVFAAVFCFAVYRKKKKLQTFKGTQLLKQQIPDLSYGKPAVKFLLFATAYALIVVALANPQMGTSIKKAERKGIDVMIALDISNSMNCNDIQPSRLMRAKQAVMRIIDKMESDRIGLVVFAGDAYLQLPLTTDYGAAKLFISNVQTSDLSRQGTAIGAAVKLCSENFDPKYEKNKNKAVIVISDGENHEDDAVAAAAEAAKKGIIVSTVGMGSVQGAPIPEYRNRQIVSYKKDRNGQVVVTRINREMLQNIARAGNGFYVEANNVSSGVETVFEKLSHLDKVSFETQNISDYETRYQYFVALALLLLIVEIFIFEKRNKVFNRDNLFGSKKMTAVVLLAVAGGCVGARAQVAIPTHKGNKLFKDSDYQEAKVSYLRALDRDSTYYKAVYNSGNTEYRQGNYPAAAGHYSKVLENPALNKDERADAYHNLGNCCMKTQDYQNAVDSYIKALQNKPGREDTRYNLAYARALLQQQQQQQQNQNKENNKDQKQQQQQQQQKDQDKKQQQQQQQEQQNQNRQNEPQPNSRQEQQQKQKQQDAERILRALENQEKNTLEKIKKNETQTRGRQVDKDW